MYSIMYLHFMYFLVFIIVGLVGGSAVIAKISPIRRRVVNFVKVQYHAFFFDHFSW